MSQFQKVGTDLNLKIDHKMNPSAIDSETLFVVFTETISLFIQAKDDIAFCTFYVIATKLEALSAWKYFTGKYLLFPNSFWWRRYNIQAFTTVIIMYMYHLSGASRGVRGVPEHRSDF